MESSALSPSGPFQTGYAETSVAREVHATGVSWPAVIAGAFVAAALSLILLALGAGLGLSAVSPWAGAGASEATLSAVAIVWLILMQVVSASMGGYLAGRLRTKWATIHTDEVYFRDTAHGFLAWAVALVVTAAFLTSAAASMVGTAAAAANGAGVGGSAQANARQPETSGYFVDSLFRADTASPDSLGPPVRAEAASIFAAALRHGELVPADSTYVAHLVSTRTGLSQADAEKRVSDVFAADQQAVETARKATAHALLWLFVALLTGAFVASVSATIGGRQRDHVVVIAGHAVSNVSDARIRAAQVG
jgi:hypothetical protein